MFLSNIRKSSGKGLEVWEKKGEKMTYRIWGPVMLIILGILFWLGKFGIIDFYWNRDWPVVLIAIGIFSLINYSARRLRKSNSKKKNKVLESLEKGDIDAEEAIRRLKKL